MAVPRLRMFGILSGGVLAVSCASIFIRYAQAEAMPTLSIAAWRLVFACTALLPYALCTHQEEIRSLSRRDLGLLVLSGLCLGLHFATWISSLAYTSVACSVALVSTGPVFVAIGSWLFLHERLKQMTIWGIVLAAVGSIVIGWGDMGQAQNKLMGDLLALAGAVFVAGYLMIGRKVRARRSLITYISLVYGVAMLILLAIVWIGRQPMLGFSLKAYGWALLLGLLPQLVGHSTLNWAVRHLSATFVSIVTLAEPICAGALAYLVLNETITVSTGIGAALVLAGIYIASYAEHR
jgi:drug/metabolite transporter (DMT)-like permease